MLLGELGEELEHHLLEVGDDLEAGWRGEEGEEETSATWQRKKGRRRDGHTGLDGDGVAVDRRFPVHAADDGGDRGGEGT